MVATSALIEIHKTLTGILAEAHTQEGTGGPPPVSIAPTSLPAAMQGQEYSFTFSAQNGTPPYSWSITNGQLPAGLTLASNGELAGTPTASKGSYQFVIRVTDSANMTDSKVLELALNEPIVVPPAAFHKYIMKRRIDGVFRRVLLKRRVNGEWVTMTLRKRGQGAPESTGVYLDIYTDTYLGNYDSYSDTYTDEYH